ncbi:MAG TPA: hypothetical protein PKB06_02170, partial [Actinotalea sp.]|nr:hypothetical protein [Actinotalea sp.]
MGVQADHRPGTELLAGRTVAYVLSGYPVLSQTFVRDEVATMRAAGVDVDVTAVAGGDGDRIPLAWSGPFRDATHVSPLAALRDGLWWLARPRAVLRLLRVFLAGGRASPKSLALGVPTIARRLAGRDVELGAVAGGDD